MKRITLKLINDERKNKKILSAKACAGYYIDLPCGGNATDTCLAEDLFQCQYYATDYCKYIDQDYCSGKVSDSCAWDNSDDNMCNGRDYCYIDNE